MERDDKGAIVPNPAAGAEKGKPQSTSFKGWSNNSVDKAKADIALPGWSKTKSASFAGFDSDAGATGKTGIILGFIVFALAYIITTVMIFIDMNKRG
tara:strand:+ start:227 stop:517 length:291 start_codon:yes stop_codon:yes gene_type:complete